MIADEQINRDLHEKILKKCWHMLVPQSDWCIKCDKLIALTQKNHPNYINNWNDYGELVKVAFANERFCEWVENEFLPGYSGIDILKLFITDSRRGSDAIWEFFCGGGR